MRFPSFIHAGLPSDFVLNESNIRLPDSLKTNVPSIINAAFENCQRAGLRAFDMVKDFTRFHEGRYEALYPRDHLDVTRWMKHSETIALLRDYHERYSSISPTPRPKLQQDSILLSVDPRAYDPWAREVDELLHRRLYVVYKIWSLTKWEVELLMRIASYNSQVHEPI
ncbi:hypothetical protein BJX64DRAFT_283966 [Aspergillus heterothallicus]